MPAHVAAGDVELDAARTSDNHWAVATPADIEERESERTRYLVAFYNLTADEPLRWASHRQIARAAELPEEHVLSISLELQRLGLVKLRTMGGLDGSVELTGNGIRMAERAIKDLPSDNPPSDFRESDEDWARRYMPMLTLGFRSFCKDLTWPAIDSLQRTLDRTGVQFDVREALVAMPRLPGELAFSSATSFHIPIRLLRFVNEATDVVSLCIELVRRAVEVYYSDVDELAVSSADPWAEEVGSREVVTAAAVLVLTDFPNPFAGGGYGANGWTLSVNGNLARRFRDVESVEDYVRRQRELREEGARQLAALIQPAGADAGIGGAGSEQLDQGPSTLQPRSIFVVMPFGENWSQGIYDFIKRAVVSLGYARECVVRADEISDPGKIDQQIVEAMKGAALVIADVTDANANVMWEAGYAEASEKPIVLINQHVDESPFDLANTRQVGYNVTPTNDDEEKLAEHIRAALANGDPPK
jgi:hypothetical protein